MERKKIDLKKYINKKLTPNYTKFVSSLKDLATDYQLLDENKKRKTSINKIEVEEIRAILTALKIPLKREYKDYTPAYFDEEEYRNPNIFGFFREAAELDKIYQIYIFKQGIYLNAFGEIICWVWPEEEKERINLLREIKEQMKIYKIYFEETYISKIEDKLYSLNILHSFENDIDVYDYNYADITKKEMEKIKLAWSYQIKVNWDGVGQSWSNYYFKRGFPFQSKWFESLDGHRYNVHEIAVNLLKYENKPDIFELYISDNTEKLDLAEDYITQDFQNMLTLLKIVDTLLIDMGYFRLDTIVENESLQYLDPIDSELMLKVANDYFLQFETFSFDEEESLEHISKKPTFRGTNWKEYSEQYTLWKKGKPQDDIAIKYNTSQQTISNHINKVEGELSRIRGEAYEKWLAERYEIERDVKKAERNGSVGEPDLVVFKHNNEVDIINAKAYNFKPSRKHLTISAKEFQPEIEKARELERHGYFVRVYIDFFNLYNNKRYPRKLIDHKNPPERISIMYTDTE